MDLKDLLPLAGAAIGVGGTALGSWLGQRSSSEQHGRVRRQQIDDQRLATYAEWAAGVEAQFNAYASQRGAAQVPDVAICEKRLLLLETNAEIRALIQAVRNTFPAVGSAEQRDLEMMVDGDPDWEYPPFRDAMNRLLDRVRND